VTTPTCSSLAQNYVDSDGENGSKYAAELVGSGALDGIEGSEKMDAVVEDAIRILDSHPENKVIIFSFFKEMGRMLQAALRPVRLGHSTTAT
jgi:hypothetical protein